MADSTTEESEPAGSLEHLVGDVTLDDLRTTAVAALVFYVLLLAAMGFTALVSPTDRLLTLEYVLIALVPFVMLLALTGKLAEIRGPGNLGLILRHEATREMPTEGTTELSKSDEAYRELEQEFEVHGEDTHPKREVTADLGYEIEQAEPSTLSFTLGKRYNPAAIREYIRLHTKYSPRFRYILFNDSDGRFAGLMRYQELLHQIDLKPGEVRDVEDYFERPPTADDEGRERDPETAQATGFIGDIESGDIVDHAGVITERIAAGASKKEGLHRMKEVDRSMLAVVDEAGKFAGVVTQDGLVREVLSDLLRSSD